MSLLTEEQKQHLNFYYQEYLKWPDRAKTIAERNARDNLLKQRLKQEQIDSLTKQDIDKVYGNLWAVGKRFKGELTSRNDIAKIRKSFRYLLYGEDDIPTRLDKLLKDDEYKLESFNKARVSELLWIIRDISDLTLLNIRLRNLCSRMDLQIDYEQNSFSDEVLKFTEVAKEIQNRYNFPDLKETDLFIYFIDMFEQFTGKEGPLPPVGTILVSDFAFNQKDFDSCTGKEDDAKYLWQRFKKLNVVVSDRTSFLKEGFRSRVPNWFKRANPPVPRNLMWLSYAKTKDPRASLFLLVQLQVTLRPPEEPLSMGIWIDHLADKTRLNVRDLILENKETFVSLLNKLPEYYLIARMKNSPMLDSTANIVHKGMEVTSDAADRLTNYMLRKGVGVFIGKIMNREQVLAKGNGIVQEIVDIFHELLPLYNFLTVAEQSKPPVTRQRLEETASAGVLHMFVNTPLFLPTNMNSAKDKVKQELLIDIDVIDQIVTSLYSGKNVILVGPVGTGKTHLAQLLPKVAWEDVGGYYPELVTATADWTTQDVIGGIFPKVKDGEVTYLVQKGCVSDSVSRNWSDTNGKSGQRIKPTIDGKQYRGIWLVIDEFNRANMDRAFGQLFTALEYKRLKIPTVHPERAYEEIIIPDDYRIIGTLNTFDKHFLFRISDALKRRFSFIEVLPPTYDKKNEELKFVVSKAFAGLDELTEVMVRSFDDLQKDTIHAQILDNLYEIMAFVRLSKNLGTALLISMLRFILINYTITKDWEKSLDNSLCTILLPQLESLQYWQIDCIMSFIGGRIHELFRKFDVNRRPDVDRYEEELKNLTRYLKMSGQNDNAPNWNSKFKTGVIMRESEPISVLDPWQHKSRPHLPKFRKALESLKKEKGYFDEISEATEE